jgi:hypothetical protein
MIQFLYIRLWAAFIDYVGGGGGGGGGLEHNRGSYRNFLDRHGKGFEKSKVAGEGNKEIFLRGDIIYTNTLHV